MACTPCYNAVQEALMSSVPIPQLPLYRITLFYGPEVVTAEPRRLSCVFNVKKRSWKGGVQIAVEFDEPQLSRIRHGIGFESWLKNALTSVPDDARREYEIRARDLFVRELCSLKLALAIETDIQQENSCLESHRLAFEVESAALERAERIKSNILTELDLFAS
jgi:hypothetical protein